MGGSACSRRPASASRPPSRLSPFAAGGGLRRRSFARRSSSLRPSSVACSLRSPLRGPPARFLCSRTTPHDRDSRSLFLIPSHRADTSVTRHGHGKVILPSDNGKGGRGDNGTARPEPSPPGDAVQPRRRPRPLPLPTGLCRSLSPGLRSGFCIRTAALLLPLARQAAGYCPGPLPHAGPNPPARWWLGPPAPRAGLSLRARVCGLIPTPRPLPIVADPRQARTYNPPAFAVAGPGLSAFPLANPPYVVYTSHTCPPIKAGLLLCSPWVVLIGAVNVRLSLQTAIAVAAVLLASSCAVVPTHQLTVHWDPVSPPPAVSPDPESPAADPDPEPTLLEPTG